MSLVRTTLARASLLPVVLLSSCSSDYVKMPFKLTGNVVSATTRVAEKAAVTSIDVAGKAAGAAVEGGISARAGLVQMMP